MEELAIFSDISSETPRVKNLQIKLEQRTSETFTVRDAKPQQRNGGPIVVFTQSR